MTQQITAELLTIGDEILYGQIIDTNSQWMGVALSDAGIRVVRKTTVGDHEADILAALAEAEKRTDIILITGGLGPTNDDLTKPCLAKYFGCGLALHPEALEDVTAFFKSRGRELTEVNRQQAFLPTCCEKVTNRMGTAPAMWFHRNGKVFVSMPGVPHEMKSIMLEIVMPRLVQTFKTPSIHHTLIRTVGIGESFLAEKIKGWETALPAHIRLAYLPGLGEVKLRLTAFGQDMHQSKKEVASIIDTLIPIAGEYIFNVGPEPLEEVLGKSLAQQHLTLAAAESCTGGYLSHLITSVPGSSVYFSGSIVPYDNAVKVRQLGVREETLEKHGAVSGETVAEMAARVREKFGTDIGVAISGVAGPGGGTDEKPVGLVWIACADQRQTETRRLQLSKDRVVNIKVATIAAMNLVRQFLNKRQA